MHLLWPMQSRLIQRWEACNGSVLSTGASVSHWTSVDTMFGLPFNSIPLEDDTRQDLFNERFLVWLACFLIPGLV